MDISRKTLAYRSSPHYNKYQESLQLYFSKDPHKLCPATGKPGITTEFKDDQYIVSCPNSNWKMTIQPTNSVNLYTEQHELSQRLHNLLKLLNIEIRKVLFEGKSSEIFETLKNEFIDKTSSYDKIETLKKDLSDELQSVDSENGELYVELSNLFIQRKSIFNEIEEMPPNKIRNDLLTIYKNEGLVDDNRTINIAKNLKLKPTVVTNYLKWVDVTHHYIKIQNKLHKNKSMYNEYKDRYDYLIKHYYIDLPEINETKSIVLDGNTSIEPKTINTLTKAKTLSETLNNKDNSESDLEIKEIEIDDSDIDEGPEAEFDTDDLESDGDVSDIELSDSDDLDQDSDQEQSGGNYHNIDMESDIESNIESDIESDTDTGIDIVDGNVIMGGSPSQLNNISSNQVEIMTHITPEDNTIVLKEIDIPDEILLPDTKKFKIHAERSAQQSMEPGLYY